MQHVQTRLPTLLALLFFAAGSAAADVIHVPADHPTIQAAIDAAGDGDEIIVAPGTYNEALNLLGKQIVLRSEAGAEATILDAAGLNAPVISCISGEGPETTIRGFTITGGTGQSVPGGPSISAGGGLVCFASSPLIIDCVFTWNHSEHFGGGLGILGNSSPEIVNCMFAHNRAMSGGGGVYVHASRVTIVGCAFTRNVASVGGAIYNRASGVLEVRESTFTDNLATSHDPDPGNIGVGRGGAIASEGSLSLHNSHFQGNRAAGVDLFSNGGAVALMPSASDGLHWRIEGCRFIANVAHQGGAIHVNGATSTSIADGTFEANHATDRGGAIYSLANANVVRCSFWRNSGYFGINAAFGAIHFRECTFREHGVGMFSPMSPAAGLVAYVAHGSTFTNCAFLGNVRGTIRGEGSVNVVNCLFLGNRRQLLVTSSNQATLTLTNCTIVGNDTEHPSNRLIGGNATIRNSILWSNVGQALSENATLEITDTIIQGGHPGEGNLDVDPLFVDPSIGHSRLLAASPAVDSGSNAFVPDGVTTDLDGNPRIVDGTGDQIAIVDRGAYEHQPGGCERSQFKYLSELTVFPESMSVTAGFTGKLHAIASTDEGDSIDVSAHVCALWFSGDTSIAEVDFEGRVRGVSAGTTTIRVTMPGLEAVAHVMVQGNGDATYVKDDGSPDVHWSSSTGGSFVWFEHFNVIEGAETVTEIIVELGFVFAPGSLNAVFLWSDPNQDGLPYDARVLASAEISAPPTYPLFERFAIRPTYVGPAGTGFFVGVVRNHLPPGQWYLTQDTTTPQGGSWFGGVSPFGDPIDPDDLGSVPGLGPMWNPGNFLIRAEGVPGFHPADLNQDGSVDVQDLLILLGAWGACGDCNDCPADLNGDCAVDVLDLLILLSNWG